MKTAEATEAAIRFSYYPHRDNANSAETLYRSHCECAGSLLHPHVLCGNSNTYTACLRIQYVQVDSSRNS